MLSFIKYSAGADSSPKYFPPPDELFGGIDVLYENLMKKADGVYADAGYRDVVMHPNLAGILAHEAVGHTVEADLVLGGSVAAHCMNKQVASELITMVDFAHTLPDGSSAPLPVLVDDEGTPAEDAILIKDGILRGYMNSRESASISESSRRATRELCILGRAAYKNEKHRNSPRQGQARRYDSFDRRRIFSNGDQQRSGGHDRRVHVRRLHGI